MVHIYRRVWNDSKVADGLSYNLCEAHDWMIQEWTWGGNWSCELENKNWNIQSLKFFPWIEATAAQSETKDFIR